MRRRERSCDVDDERTNSLTHSVISGLLLFALALGACWPQGTRAQGNPARALITTPIDETRLAILRGNVRPEANAQNDRGRVSDSLRLEHIQLLLRRPPEREQALQRYIAELHDRSSPNFHRWLTPVQLAVRFGLSQQDIRVVTGWLGGHGFAVNTVYPSGAIIDFSGTAGAVHAAFHCEIHALSVSGIRHIANMSDPQIPAALAPAVAGIVSLNDFRPHALHEPRAQYTFSTTAGTYEVLVPGDLATIYNFNPLFAAGVSGQNQTVVVIEDTDVYSTADWSTFRSTFGLSSYTSGSFTQIHPAPPSGSNNCTDPGVVTGDDFEAILDAEWSSAAAPSAAIELASCADSGTTFGGLIALTNLINGTSPPAIVSFSYGECEAFNGATANAAYASTYEQAVSEGVSVFVAAGDSGAAACDHNETHASHGIGVNGFASTPYNVAAGGTDFGDSYAGTNSTYWSTTNGTYYASALSYVPEIPWNGSCASVLIAAYLEYPTTYGSSGFCNSSTASADGLLTTHAGGGGPSGCASGAPSVTGVVSGTCSGTPKPTWQSGVPGNPNDSVRDLPDVSLFASNGFWGHYYVVCWSNTAEMYAEPCTGAPSTWSGGGGTSFVAPILAGLQALVNQSTGSRQGNPNYVLYTLATSQSASSLPCNSSSGNAVSSGCVFYDVTLGDMDVDCHALNGTYYDCYRPSGTYGVLSTSNSAYAMAYGTATGWDFATGIGSINATNLVHYWASSDLALSGGGSVTAANQLSYALTIEDRGPQSAPNVVVSTVIPSGFSLVTASSSSGCMQSGLTVTCSLGMLGVLASAPVMIVLQPSGPPETVDLTFTASSGNADLDPADGSDAVALNWPGESVGSASGDGPLPLWASLALGAVLLALGARQAARIPGRAR
jgi:uncharacterized repeat protein (TIGR01451 family)